MENADFFLWPKRKLPQLHDYLKTAPSHHEIEQTLATLYPNSYPVLFSSGRSGLHAILQLKNCSRPDLVWCPPYSSHCVFDSISRLATPTTLPDVKGIKVAVLFHQWGFTHTSSFNKDVVLVEDAADTLLSPGADVFVADGDFSLFSLPKSLATAFGGVVFCKNEEDARGLRKIRDVRGRALSQSVLRLFSGMCSYSSALWNGSEAAYGPLPWFARNQIAQRLGKVQAIADERFKLIEKLSPKLAKAVQKTGRIPCVIPLKKDKAEPSGLWDSHITTGFRNFNLKQAAPEAEWKPVAPMPVHLDVTQEVLAQFTDAIGEENLKDESGCL